MLNIIILSKHFLTTLWYNLPTLGPLRVYENPYSSHWPNETECVFDLVEPP